VMGASDRPPAEKDPGAAHPIAGAWRPMLGKVVQRFVEGDFHLARGVRGVERSVTRDTSGRR
jgi:hypothetical protein